MTPQQLPPEALQRDLFAELGRAWSKTNLGDHDSVQVFLMCFYALWPQIVADKALRSAAPSGEPVAYAIRNSDGKLHSLTTTRELAERTARQLNQSLTPLYASPQPSSYPQPSDLSERVADETLATHPQPSSDARAVAEELTKRIQRKAQALADDPENGYVEGDTNAFIWTNSEAEWQSILLDELAEEFRAYAVTLSQSKEGT